MEKHTKKMKNNNNREIILDGQAVSSGIVIGHATLYRRIRPTVSKARISESGIDSQLEQFNSAKQVALQELYDLLKNQSENTTADLIEMQIEIVNDPDMCKRVEQEIANNNKPADSAVEKIFEEYLAFMKEADERFYQERLTDIIDIRDRLIQILHNHKEEKVSEGAILVSSELSPREVIQFSEQNIKGFVMDHGGTTSHAAIIARSLNIPAVVGLKKASENIEPHSTVILDGSTGKIIVHPEAMTLEAYHRLMEEQTVQLAEWEKMCRLPNKTTDGASYILRANIELTDELESVLRYQAEGVGLLRTESLYLQRKNFADQQKQQQFYREILDNIDPHPLTIRLFDAGGDTFFEDKNSEHNPFLGWRGIRMLLDEEELLQNQLRAILTIAAEYRSRVRILVPMVSTLEEVEQIKELISRVQNELGSKGVNIDEKIQLGIMVEVPSVALQAEAFAKEVDFLSIGTNDLTQYALAVDRGNERISRLYDQRHPAVWQLIKKVAEGTQQTGITVSICGELASDPIAACCLVGMGIPELSMSPGRLPAVKQYLRSFSMEELKMMSEKILACDAVAEIDQVYNEIQTLKTENR